MTTTSPAPPRTAHRAGPAALVVASHPGPAVVVTTVTALLAVAAARPVGATVVVAAAVLAGQLGIGWANDLLDRRRDAAVGRTDKPLATGGTTTGTVRWALALSLVACVALSLAAGWRSGAVHLLLGVGAAHAYNLGFKATVLSWLPFAVAFGSLPAVASLAGDGGAWPAWPLVLASACLGVGAHVLNALPDLADDARTGVRGMPHRLGERRARPLAAALLVAASLAAALGPAGAVPGWAWAVLVAVAALAVVALRGRGTVPFWAASTVALLDVVLLVGAAR